MKTEFNVTDGEWLIWYGNGKIEIKDEQRNVLARIIQAENNEQKICNAKAMRASKDMLNRLKLTNKTLQKLIDEHDLNTYVKGMLYATIENNERVISDIIKD
jgi:hypothetical protein